MLLKKAQKQKNEIPPTHSAVQKVSAWVVYRRRYDHLIFGMFHGKISLHTHTTSIFGTVIDIASIFYHTKNQVGGLCVGGISIQPTHPTKIKKSLKMHKNLILQPKKLKRHEYLHQDGHLKCDLCDYVTMGRAHLRHNLIKLQKIIKLNLSK